MEPSEEKKEHQEIYDDEDAFPLKMTDFILQHYQKVIILERNKVIGDAVHTVLNNEGYKVTVVQDKEQAMELCSTGDYDVLIISEGMTADGLILKDQIDKSGVSIDLRIIKDFGSAILSHKADEDYQKIHMVYSESLSLMISLLESVSAPNVGHSRLIGEYSGKLADKLSLSSKDCETIKIAGYFHDLPRLAGDFLRKMEEIGSTSSKQAIPINQQDFYKTLLHEEEIRTIIHRLRERYDGKGYPDGLKEKEIPVGSRIISVADVYVHMIRGARNRKPLKRVNAMAQLQMNAGSAFDPEIVKAFLEILKQELMRDDRSESKEQILIVDESSKDDLLKLRLRDEGYRVIASSDVKQALDFIKEKNPDLIISEVDYSEMDGFQFLEYLKKSKETRGIPFVFLSAKNDSSYIARALRTGAEDYILKPYNLDVLVLKLQRILLRSAPEQGLTLRERRGVTGSLLEMGLLEIIQVLGAGNRSAMVELSRDSENAKIYLEDGQIVSAAYGDLDGEEAFYHIMNWEDGEFTIHPNVPPPVKNIFTPNDMLLLKGFHKLDESRRQYPG